MASSVINVRLSDSLQTYVDGLVESGYYDTASEYILALILNDRERRLKRLEDQLLDALKSEPIEIADEEWDRGDIIEICRRKLQESR